MKNKLIAIGVGFIAQILSILIGGNGDVAFILAACFVYIDSEMKRLKGGER